jgi:predicted GNAT family N-acyltransferase
MSSEMEIEIRAPSQIRQIELDHMSAWVAQVFHGSSPDDMQWSSDDWHVMVRVNGQVVSRVGIVERTSTVSGQSVKLGGIGGVATQPDSRKRGYAEAALKTAAEFIRNELEVEFGLLICSAQMTRYYRKLGWQLVEGPLMFDQPKGKVTFDGSTKIMILPCTKSDWPPGVIDLCGPPW